jgi:hypothetical protein
MPLNGCPCLLQMISDFSYYYGLQKSVNTLTAASDTPIFVYHFSYSSRDSRFSLGKCHLSLSDKQFIQPSDNCKACSTQGRNKVMYSVPSHCRHSGHAIFPLLKLQHMITKLMAGAINSPLQKFDINTGGFLKHKFQNNNKCNQNYHFGITRFLDFVHRPVFWKLENTIFRKLDLFPSSGGGGERTPN